MGHVATTRNKQDNQFGDRMVTIVVTCGDQARRGKEPSLRPHSIRTEWGFQSPVPNPITLVLGSFPRLGNAKRDKSAT